MIDIETGNTLNISDNFICEQVNEDTALNVSLTKWRLDAIKTIVTTQTLENSEARIAALNSDIEQRRMTNVALGGVAGAVIDGIGGEDTILDGVLLGAAFGFLVSPSKVTSDPTAKIGILFVNGESLALEVNSDEYTLLQAAALKEEKHIGEPKETLSLSKEQMISILDNRRQSSIQRRFVIVFTMGMAFVLSLAAVTLGTSFISEGDQSPFTHLYAHLADIVISYGPIVFAALLVPGLLLLYWAAASQADTFIQGEDEKQAFVSAV